MEKDLTLKRHNTEDVFQRQKTKVKELKEKYIEMLIENKERAYIKINSSGKKSSIYQNDPYSLQDNTWYLTSFDYEIFNGEEVPIILSNYWESFTIDQNIANTPLGNGTEIRNRILKNSNLIDFNLYRIL